MKRIALFSITYDPFIGGAEIAIKEITNRLGSDKFSARGGPLQSGGQAAFGWDLFTARLNVRLPSEERIGNVNVYRAGSGRPFLDKLLYPWRASRLAVKMHHQKPYDLIHAVLETYAGLAALLFKKREPRIPYLLTMQSGDSDWFIKLRTWFWYPWYRQIYTKANKITAISLWLKDRAQRYGAKEEDIVIIPNAVDQRFSQEVSKERQKEIRESWGADRNDFVVITASRLVRKNGIDILIDAMEHVSENVKLVIAGTGKDEGKLKAQAKKFGDRVLFLGHVGHEKLPELLWTSDVFVRPSRSEGMGNSFVEAKAAGLTVIGTPVGGIKDLIKAGIVEGAEGSARGIAEKIVASMERARRQSPNRGRDVIRERYTWDVVARQYEREYEKLLAPKHVPGS